MAVPVLSWQLALNPAGDLDSDFPDGNPSGGPVWGTVPSVLGPFVEGIARTIPIRDLLEVDPGGASTIVFRNAANSADLTLTDGWSFDGDDLNYSGTGVASFETLLKASHGGNDALAANTMSFSSVDSPVVWPDQTVSHLTVVPKHSTFIAAGDTSESYGGWGRQPSGLGLPAPVYCNIRRTGGSGDGAAIAGKTRWYEGSIDYFAGLPSPKVACFNKGLYIQTYGDPRFGSYASLLGQCQPKADPVIWRGTQLTAITSYSPEVAGTHLQFWCLDIRAGDDAQGFPPNLRDTAVFGMTSSNVARAALRQVAINCVFSLSIDELVDAYTGGDLGSMLYCAFVFPLHLSRHTNETTGANESHGVGPILGVGRSWDRFSMSRCFFAHSGGRNPMLGALRGALSNLLIYNGNDHMQLVGDGSGTPPYEYNITDSLVVRGPQSSGSHNFVGQQGLPGSSRGHLSGNCVYGTGGGWTAADQQALMVANTGAFPTGFYDAAIRANAWPAGWGASKQGIFRIAAAAPAITQTEALLYHDLMAASVGPNPAFRPSSANGKDVLSLALGHCRNSISGSGSTGSNINSVNGTASPSTWPGNLNVSPSLATLLSISNAWPSLTGTEVDVFSPGSEYHAPMPTVEEGRDTVQTSGTLFDGSTKVGRMGGECWAINEWLYKTGRYVP